VLCTHWQDGAAGAADLAREVAACLAASSACYAPLYPDEMGLAEKIVTVARAIYRAADVAFPDSVRRRLAAFEQAGYRHFPVCIAKTQYSFTADPTRLGAPEGHVLPVREARLAAGAGFVVAICGDIATMPGLPRVPAAEAIGLAADGTIRGMY
jgi:formate--tetrahydrofolate ligase